MGIRHHQPQDVPIQPEGLPSDRTEITAGLPCVNHLTKMLAGQMAGATSTPLRMMMPLPLRFQGLRASEPTLRRRAPSGSPPLLVSSGHCPQCRSPPDSRGHSPGTPVPRVAIEESVEGRSPCFDSDAVVIACYNYYLCEKNTKQGKYFIVNLEIKMVSRAIE